MAGDDDRDVAELSDADLDEIAGGSGPKAPKPKQAGHIDPKTEYVSEVPRSKLLGK